MIKKQNIIEYVLLFLIIAISLCGLKDHISLDTYSIIHYGYENYAINIFSVAGRPFSAIMLLIMEVFCVPIKLVININLFLAILISTLTIITFRNKIAKYDNNKNTTILLIISFMTIFNFMYLENFQFIECPIICLGILFSIFLADAIVNNNIFKSLVYGILIICCYQGVLNTFIFFVLLFSLIKYKKDFKQIAKCIILSGVICGILYILNYLNMFLLENIIGKTQNRFNNIENIFNNIIYIFKNIGYIITYTSYLFPKNLLIMYMVSIIIISSIFLILKKRFIEILPIIILTLFTFPISCSQHIITLSSFGSGRLLFPIGALIGGLLLLIYTNVNDLFIKYKKIFLCIVFSYIIVTIILYIVIIYNHNLTIQEDIKNIKKIECFIQQYENNNQTKLKKIAFTYDTNETMRYYQIISNKSTFCNRALWADISIIGAINYYTNRNLQEIPMDESIYEKYFLGKDWNELNKEQFVFIGDAMYYCVY